MLDTEFGRERRRLPGHAGGISDIVVLPHGRLLTCGQDGEVAYSSVRAGRDIMRLRTAGTALQMARQTPSGNFVATSHSTAEIFRWEARGQLSGRIALGDHDTPCVQLHAKRPADRELVSVDRGRSRRDRRRHGTDNRNVWGGTILVSHGHPSFAYQPAISAGPFAVVRSPLP